MYNSEIIVLSDSFKKIGVELEFLIQNTYLYSLFRNFRSLIKMSIKSRSKDSSASTTSSSKSEGDSGSEVDCGSNVSEDESNFTLVEIHHTDTKTICKLCFRTAQVTF